MSRRTTRPVRLGASLAALAVAGVFLPVGPASAAGEDGVDVINTETVQVYTDASGDIQTRRVYEQLTLTGQGLASFENPVAETGLRNLDGFSGFEVSDGVQRVETEVDGVQHMRTVSDYQGDLPLDVTVEYLLDGEEVEPGDIVGKDGELEVRYTVRNVTGTPQEISFPDGQGGTITETVEVPLPMVGSLSTTLPATFTEVHSDQANMAGDGKGGTKLSFTMTLVPPIGSDTATFGYTARIRDGVVPRASLSALPVNPLESATFSSAANSYQGGAETGATLTAGAAEIDSNLLKIRDGAAKLLNGLIQLRDGSQQLEAGLVGEAAPGARKLADGALELDNGLAALFAGAGQLSDGAGRLDDGAGKVADGSGKLADGAGQVADGAGKVDDGAGKVADGAKKLDAGANQLADGLAEAGSKAPALLGGLTEVRKGLVKVDAGLKQMYDGVGAVKDDPRYLALLDGLDTMLAGVGTRDSAGTLTWAVDQLRTKFTTAVPKVQAMADGVYKNDPANPGAYQKLGCAVEVVKLLNTGVGSATNPCFAEIKATLDSLGVPWGALGAEANPLRAGVLAKLATQLDEGRTKLATPDGATNETTLYGGLKTLLDDLTRQSPTAPGAIAALTAMQCSLDSTTFTGTPADGTCAAIGRGGPGLRQGLQQVVAGVPTLVNTIIGTVQSGIGQADHTPADETLRGGMNGLIGGVDELSAGGNTLLEGLGLLSEGAGTLAAGTGELADGASELSTGAGDLADGAGQVATGAGDLADGAGELAAGAGDLADGAGQLAAGAGDAKDGSGLIAGGAGELADGLFDAATGAGRLAAGLEEAAEAAPALPEGAQRLSVEGMGQLIEAGKGTAQEYGKLYAIVAAGSERAQAESMALGAPEDARGLTAYSYEITGEDGEGGRNLVRALGAVVVGGLGLGAVGLRRRFLV